MLPTNKPIIPIGHKGYVAYHRKLGVEFPDWIDYSYDDIDNNEQRLRKVISVIEHVSKMENLTELSNEFHKTSNNKTLYEALSFKQEFINVVNTFFGE